MNDRCLDAFFFFCIGFHLALVSCLVDDKQSYDSFLAINGQDNDPDFFGEQLALLLKVGMDL